MKSPENRNPATKHVDLEKFGEKSESQKNLKFLSVLA